MRGLSQGKSTCFRCIFGIPECLVKNHDYVDDQHIWSVMIGNADLCPIRFSFLFMVKNKNVNHFLWFSLVLLRENAK